MCETVVELLESNEKHVETFKSRFDDVQDSQHPGVVTVCCSDSRVLQDHIWGNDEPGQIFTVGNIGNRVVQQTAVGEEVSGDVLYPVEHTGTKTIVVIGHSGCGAVTATYDELTDGLSEPPGIEHCIDLLKPHLEPALDLLPDDVDRNGAINRLVEYNVDWQVEFLKESGDIPDDVDVIGVVYDFMDVYGGPRGKVYVVNVNGNRSAEGLREEHPELGEWVARVWEY
ncbi:carbonic anhydrase [Haladaptatus sp. DYSN1]|uniref:carbonic anhydrase n=1 Tax=unclassified Haladaptatus TaxID=2622732 RepID=UPI002405D69D|nr:carbonic anhydrase [Haladaptatus sp. DYSN1]